MADSTVFITSALIPDEQVMDMIISLGGEADAPPGLGRISNGKQHVWIAKSQEELEVSREMYGAEILKKLGDDPKTAIVVDVSRNMGSRDLLKKFAGCLIEKFQVVVLDGQDTILSGFDFLAQA